MTDRAHALKLDDFDFDLPPTLIAQRPARPRDAARMLFSAPDGSLADKGVMDLPDLLLPGDVLVVNDTRVIPARLHGLRHRGEATARIELLLANPLEDGRWRALARPAKRLKRGEAIIFADGFRAIMDGRDGGAVIVRLEADDGDIASALLAHGETPLPPYIERETGADADDAVDYQTVFATRDGSVAAPTASLHFTDRLLAALDARGVTREVVTLHVGPGTFLPVKADDPRAHRMHGEWGELPADVASRLNAARGEGRRIVAVGTTALRLLETAALAQTPGEAPTIHPFRGETSLFILPGHDFRAVDGLMTNFHLPRSTLFMLVAALIGRERARAAYAHAIEHGYRFYSYGDSSLLWRAVP